MYNTVFCEKILPGAFCEREALRYARAGDDGETAAALRKNLNRCGDTVGFVCWIELPVAITGKRVDFGVFSVESTDLARNLSGCESAVLFAATIGLEMDRLIRKYSRLSLSDGVLLQAIGAERVEAVCDAFNDKITKEMREKGLYTRPRFSAGYGDLPLSAQTDILRVLEASKKVGITLNESLIMSPSKSVTAFIGVSSKTGRVGDEMN